MTGYQVYRFYLAIKLHFTNPKYDVFETRGHVKNCTPESFQSKRGRGMFETLAKRLKEPKDVVQYFVANQAYGGDIFEPSVAEDNFIRWKKHKEMMTYLVREDLEQIDDLRAYLSGDPCKLMKEISGQRINIETAVAINRKLQFADDWKGNYTYPDLWLKIKKLDRFVKFNEQIIFEKIDEIYSTSR